MSNKPITMFVGDTFLANAVYRDADGDPVNLNTAGIQIEANAHSPDGTKKVALAVTIKDQVAVPGGFQIKGDTGDWGEVSVWRVRITYVNADGRFSPDPVLVELVP